MRYYSSIAGEMRLTAGINAVIGSAVLDTTAGLPVAVPYTLVLDVGESSEEIVTVTAIAGNTVTITRGEDGSTAQVHTVGAKVRHQATARDLREPQDHAAATTNVHGVSGTVVGTTSAQVLTNKTISGASNTITNLPTTSIVDSAITTLKLATNAVTTAKVTDLAITNAKLADDAVTLAKMANASVGTAELVDNSVTLAKMADAAVGTVELVDASVTSAKLASGVRYTVVALEASPPASPAPAAGDQCYAQDTKATGIYDGSVWRWFDSIWQTYTPVVRANTTVATIGSGTINGRYFRVGKKVTVHLGFLFGTGTTYNGGTGVVYITTPSAVATLANAGFVVASSGDPHIGTWHAIQSSTTFDGHVNVDTATYTQVKFIIAYEGNIGGGGGVTTTNGTVTNSLIAATGSALNATIEYTEA